MIYSYMKSLKFANNLILTFPSNPTLPASLHPTEKPFNQTCVAYHCQVSTTTARSQKAQKSNGKVMKKWMMVNTSCKSIQKSPEG